jgi:hypothetical protein
MFSESDFENLQVSNCENSVISDFLKAINSETIGRKVSIALDQKKQGHFNKAMLNITEANRDQVLAIREIHIILDKLDNRDKTEIILENFRQVFPFQIGITNGDKVLNLLGQIKSEFTEYLSNIISELHNNENEFSLLTEEFNFFQERMQGRISDNELDLIRKKLSGIADNIFSIKSRILNNLISFISEKHNAISLDDKFKLIKNIYIILTSSIETLDAKFVEI